MSRVAKIAAFRPKRRLSQLQAKRMAVAPNMTDMRRRPKSVEPKRLDQILRKK